ncbi:hypothetical protein RIF29_12741 [Crotalaria pallida]|uniref:Uncharacterized protein n=1 Tax=Crotalaria pallida TaxID=3830 RepID=A0AAN9P1H2_CROPI
MGGWEWPTPGLCPGDVGLKASVSNSKALELRWSMGGWEWPTPGLCPGDVGLKASVSNSNFNGLPRAEIIDPLKTIKARIIEMIMCKSIELAIEYVCEIT